MIRLIKPIDMNEFVSWYEYAQPIVSACSGFAKSNGSMLWEADGTLTVMSSDKSWLYMVTGLRPSNINMVCNVKIFNGCRNEPNTAFTNTNALGDNLLYNEILALKNKYLPYISGMVIPYYETDMDTMEGFQEALARKSTEAIPTIKFHDPYGQNIFYASKSITPITKGDTSKLYIYPDITYTDPRISVFKYVVHKKKFNLDINIISRQMRVTT